MPTLLVFDRAEKPPKFVLGFDAFLRRVLEVEPALGSRQWVVYDAYEGHSEQLFELEERVEKGPVAISLEELLRILDPSDAYIEHIMLKAGDGYYIGRFDSAFNVLSGPSDVLERVQKGFTNAEVRDEPWDESRR